MLQANNVVSLFLSLSLSFQQNSVRHNLSLHSRFVKVQNESSGKSSWWTVNLDAKSTRGRRRSSSVDNGNGSSPRAKKKDKKKQLKKMKGTGSQSDLQTGSPCDSPTASQGFHQSPWSPSIIDCPSPTNSERSATYSPVSYSPVLQRHSRNVTPVSPLVSPPALDHPEGVFNGSTSNSPLLDSFQESSLSGGFIAGELTTSSPVNQQTIDSFASLNLRSSREGMGSSSSLSSLNSPRLQQLKTSQQHVFNFSLPSSFEPSPGYSSTGPEGDQTNQQMETSTIPPPAYEDHVPPGPSRLSCGTPTRHRSVAIHVLLHVLHVQVHVYLYVLVFNIA